MKPLGAVQGTVRNRTAPARFTYAKLAGATRLPYGGALTFGHAVAVLTVSMYGGGGTRREARAAAGASAIVCDALSLRRVGYPALVSSRLRASRSWRGSPLQRVPAGRRQWRDRRRCTAPPGRGPAHRHHSDRGRPHPLGGR